MAKARRHVWAEIGSGEQKCTRCALFRVYRRKPGRSLSRSRDMEYEVRDAEGDVLEVKAGPVPCALPHEGQEDLLDPSRFE